MNDKKYEFIRLENLGEYIQNMRSRREYNCIFNLLYNLLNKKNIRLGNVGTFLHKINHPNSNNESLPNSGFEIADIQSLVWDFFDKEDSLAEVTRGLHLILNICAKTSQEKFMTATLLDLVNRKFEGEQRRSLLRTYLAGFASLFAQVHAELTEVEFELDFDGIFRSLV